MPTSINVNFTSSFSSSSAGCVATRPTHRLDQAVSSVRDARYFLVKFLEYSGYKGIFRLAYILQVADVIR